MDGPFGVFQQSGLGREGGAEDIDQYTIIPYIGVRNPWASLPSPGTGTPA